MWFYRFPNIVAATALAVCPVSGNVAIALGKTIRIYAQTASLTSPFTCFLEVDSYFDVTMLSLCLDTLAYACAKEMQVIRIDLRTDPARANGASGLSPPRHSN